MFAFQWDNPSVIMVVFNVTNEMSFKACEKWLRRARNHNPNITCPGVFSIVVYCTCKHVLAFLGVKWTQVCELVN